MFAHKTPISAIAVLLLATSAALADAPEKAQWRAEGLSEKLTLEALREQEESGRQFSRFRVVAAEDFRVLKLVHREAAAKAIPDFQASVEINSTIPGIRLAVRTVLPNHLDPRTNQPLVTYLQGTRYEQPGEWQTLNATASSDAIKAAIRSLRTELQQSEIEVSGMYFDACVLIAESHRGEAFLDVAETEWGPVVAPERIVEVAPKDTTRMPSTGKPAVYIERERLMVGDRSMFLRLVPDHGESISTLRSLGINAVWVPDANATITHS